MKTSASSRSARIGPALAIIGLIAAVAAAAPPRKADPAATSPSDATDASPRLLAGLSSDR